MTLEASETMSSDQNATSLSWPHHHVGWKADRFSRKPLFHHFYLKVEANVHFNSVFWNIGWFNRKTANTVRFFVFKLRISIILMYLRSNLTSEICPKKRGLNGKTEQNRLNVTLPPFFQITIAFMGKQKTLFDFIL